MDRKCDKCNRRATHHSVEIVQGKKIEQHLCETHAAEAGLSIKAVNTPINELLTNFVKLHSGGQAMTAAQELVCDVCGLTFAEFREHTLLGCPHCYQAFERQISPLLERAHDGGGHHVGKVPRRCGSGQDRQEQLTQLRQRLDEAVTREDYELAARLRDDIHRICPPSPGSTERSDIPGN
ncbi:MAG: UvrB/UvrC motif-containing protein [Phycisphaeraceae bacterium]|nr:UvrB/UvrC motif-containing protein [Phycisphaeraceae bacterium]